MDSHFSSVLSENYTTPQYFKSAKNGVTVQCPDGEIFQAATSNNAYDTDSAHASNADCIGCKVLDYIGDKTTSEKYKSTWHNKRVICDKGPDVGIKKVIFKETDNTIFMIVDDNANQHYEDTENYTTDHDSPTIKNISASYQGLCRCPDGDEYYTFNKYGKNANGSTNHGEISKELFCENGKRVSFGSGGAYIPYKHFLAKCKSKKDPYFNKAKFFFGVYDNNDSVVKGIYKGNNEQGNFVVGYERKGKFDKLIFKVSGDLYPPKDSVNKG